MIRISRRMVVLAAAAFGLYPVFLALVGLEDYSSTLEIILAVAIYVVCIVASVVLYDSVELPVWQARANVFASVAIPALVLAELEASHVGTYATWFVGAIASLGAATAFRGRTHHAVLMVMSVTLQVVIWGGPSAINTTGIFGAIVFVVVGSLMSRGVLGAMKATEEAQAKTLATVTKTAFVTAAREEHKKRIAAALATALPALGQLAKLEKPLDSSDQKKMFLLESTLRDEIRGRGLMNDRIREAVASARKRGIEVMVLDEGGLDSTSADERTELLDHVATAMDGVADGRITLRAPAGESWRITLVASRPGIATPDLWLKL
jgi:hypothetical protein